MVTGKAGSKSYRENVTRYSDTIADKFSFSVTGGYREDEGTRGVNDSRRVPKATGRVKYQLSDRSTVQFFAGFNESESGMELTLFTPRTDAHIRSNYQMLRLEHQFSDTSQFHFQVYRDSYEIHSTDKAVTVDEDKYDVELQHSFALGDKHHFVWGGNYRSTEVDSKFLNPTSDHDDLIGLFLQDEFTILDNLSFIAGVKYEHNSFTGGDWSPRGCILYSPGSNHHFRFSVSRAYRTPTFFADKAYLRPFLPEWLQAINVALVKGNEHLDPEEMTAIEFGYRTTLFRKIGLNVEGYYNELDKVIDAVTPVKLRPLQLSVDNSYNAIAKGIEVSVDVPITPWWMVRANYTFQEMENKRENKDILGTPKHKFNIWSSFTFTNGFSLDLMAHYVDDTKWSGLGENVTVDDYVRLDIRISQKLFNDRVELSFTGQNITDKLHPEYSDSLVTYEVERLLYGQVTLRF
jgi:iron complex outermembrane receptor protein